jgi:toxin-antitoxin system PIN domain toxin
LTARNILADVNLWLATLVERHPHHESAEHWWREVVLSAEGKVAFCRVTQLGLLRLLTNQKVMGEQRKTLSEAWLVYERLLEQDPVVYADEPKGIDAILRKHCELGGLSTKFWTDGYLAAFAEAGDFSLATFDRDFRRYPNLELTLLP